MQASSFQGRFFMAIFILKILANENLIFKPITTCCIIM